MMAASADIKPGAGHCASEGRLSWPVFLLTLAAVTSSTLSALSLYQLKTMRDEVEILKSDISQTREEWQKVSHRGQSENIHGRENYQELQDLPESQHAVSQIRRKRNVAESEMLDSTLSISESLDTLSRNLSFLKEKNKVQQGSRSCLQLLANNSRQPFRKDLPSGLYTGIPWQAGLRTGSALEADDDRIAVKEAGFYFVYSQVYYMDSTFTMGHVVIRRKRYVVGNEDQDVHLFRCIQSMDPDYAFNTCYTGGIVKLEKGDYLELLIPRSMAKISMEGDSTFLGAFKLA